MIRDGQRDPTAHRPSGRPTGRPPATARRPPCLAGVMRWPLVACGLCLACGGDRADPPAVAVASVPPVKLAPARAAARRAEARALERGTSGTRDYRRAAAIYDELCAEGCGDHAACRELIDLALHERGTVMTAARVAIPARLCDRGDQVACNVAAMLGVRDPAAATGDLDVLCAAGDRKACEVSVHFDLGDVGEVLARPRLLAACNAGVADGCASLFAGLWPSCAGHGTAPGTPCVQERASEWKADGGDPTPLVTAWQQAQALCAHGDAKACDGVPGKELDELALCEAGDYLRCEGLADRGDDRARSVACAGGITELCTPPRPRPPTGPLEALRARDLCSKGDHTACAAASKRTEIVGCPL